MTFIDGVLLFENQRLPGFETDKSDMEFIKLLDAASKVYFQIHIFLKKSYARP